MNEIPTAEEFLNNHYEISHYYDDKQECMVCFSDDVQKAMIEFAKLHVKAALEAAAANVCMKHEEGSVIDPEGDWIVDKDSILNAYPENLIQ